MSSQKERIIHLKKGETLQQIAATYNQSLIVDFYADWCGPCKRLVPIIEENLTKYSGFIVVKVNVDDFPELAEEHEVSGIPHVILIRDGKTEQQFTGFDQNSLIKMMQTAGGQI